MFVNNVSFCYLSSNGLLAELADQHVKFCIDNQIQSSQIGMLNVTWIWDARNVFHI